MAEWHAAWQKLVADFERERDELKLRLHLAKAEGRDELDKLDARIAELRQRADAASSEAKDAMGDITEAAKKLAAEIRQGLDRVRKTL